MPFNTYRPDMMGTAALDQTGPLTCGDWTSLTYTYTAGFFGIDDLGGLKICFRSATDQSALQFDDPKAPGYVSVTASNGARLNCWYKRNSNIRPWGVTLFIQCGNFLSEDDTITVVFGDQSQGGPGLRLQTFCEDTFEFRTHVDAFSTYDYVLLPQAHQPVLKLTAGAASTYRAILPTLRGTGDSFALGLKAEDRWGNPTGTGAAELFLRPSRPLAGLPERVTLDNTGTARIDGLTLSEGGDVSVDVVDADGNLMTRSNILRVADAPAFRHYWSDMHGQSEETIGTNTARDYFAFARDKGMVDICGHQGNDFQITDTFWDELNRITAEFNQPGRFLAIPGYEWSGNTSVGGDHNVWFREEGRPILRAHRALCMEDSTPENECHDAHQLFDRLQGEDALVVAHVGGRFADVSYAHDARLEPSVEVHSAWGTFDWIFEDAMNEGYRVGIVAASDGHKGRPGASYPGGSKFGSCGGLTCHLMPDLTRDDLFTAFRRRRHYATTGCRAYLDVKISGLLDGSVELPGDGAEAAETARIGDILSSSNETVTLEADIAGHAGIERIEIRDGLEMLSYVQPGLEARTVGNRIRVQCEGAEYKGRGRLVNWDMLVQAEGHAVTRTAAVNFWNPDRTVTVEDSNVSWSNVTTGGTHAVDIWLDDASAGALQVRSNLTDFTLDLAGLGTEDHVQDCGGLGKAVRVTRLPDAPLDRMWHGKLEVPMEAGKERALYLRVTFEDGHIAWSSPIYLTRR